MCQTLLAEGAIISKYGRLKIEFKGAKLFTNRGWVRGRNRKTPFAQFTSSEASHIDIFDILVKCMKFYPEIEIKTNRNGKWHEYELF